MRICIVIPVFNEARSLHDNILRLHGFLSDWNRHGWEIVIANNGSTDETLAVARRLSGEHAGIRTIHLDQKGRGRALRTAWMAGDADVLSYMDADLSSDLGAFPSLIRSVAEDGYDLAVGSRLLNPAFTTRCWKREAASRGYNALVKLILGTHFSDAQCGFKAISRSAAQRLLPLVQDNGWFFDTELLALAEWQGYRIHDLPVRWVENPHSRVNIIQTAITDLRGLMRLRRHYSKTPSPRRVTLAALPSNKRPVREGNQNDSELS